MCTGPKDAQVVFLDKWSAACRICRPPDREGLTWTSCHIQPNPNSLLCCYLHAAPSVRCGSPKMVAVLGQAHSLLTHVSATLKAHLAMQYSVGVLTQYPGLLVMCVAWLVAQELHDGAREGELLQRCLAPKNNPCKNFDATEAVRPPAACIAALRAFIIMLFCCYCVLYVGRLSSSHRWFW